MFFWKEDYKQLKYLNKFLDDGERMDKRLWIKKVERE